jgi:ABC-type Fe3+-siderophore transport system permease subunit
MKRALSGYTFWILFLVAAAMASLRFGAASDLDWAWIVELRLPRLVLACTVGAALSLSGAVLQATFKNPLCEPYTLGVSSGASLGAVIGASLGWVTFKGVSPLAFLGAALFSGILILAARSRALSSSSLLLVGVMLGFFGSSCVAVWMALADPAGIQSALSWLLGDLSRAQLPGAVFAGIVTLFCGVLIFRDHRAYDAFLLGEETAVSIGIDLSKLRFRAILFTSILVALSVSLAGMIGFVGLIVPQWVRRTGSSLHARVLPLSALAGGGVVVFADLIARTLFVPHELPVGVVTALVGAPFFVFTILRSKRNWR